MSVPGHRKGENSSFGPKIAELRRVIFCFPAAHRESLKSLLECKAKRGCSDPTAHRAGEGLKTTNLVAACLCSVIPC